MMAIIAYSSFPVWVGPVPVQLANSSALLQCSTMWERRQSVGLALLFNTERWRRLSSLLIRCKVTVYMELPIIVKKSITKVSYRVGKKGFVSLRNPSITQSWWLPNCSALSRVPLWLNFSGFNRPDLNTCRSMVSIYTMTDRSNRDVILLWFSTVNWALLCGLVCKYYEQTNHEAKVNKNKKRIPQTDRSAKELVLRPIHSNNSFNRLLVTANWASGYALTRLTVS